MKVPIRSYGILSQTSSSSEAAVIAELIRLRGYAVVSSGFTPDELGAFRQALLNAQEDQKKVYGEEYLTSLGEQNIVRAPLCQNELFLNMAKHPLVLEVCQLLIGEYIILNQQNGVINPKEEADYSQRAFHRDLPYQHWTSSRPLAVNALFCIDPFEAQNGATIVIPGSHRVENFPSDAVIRETQVQIEASAGSILILDCMLYHAAGINKTPALRCGVNHVYSTPIIQQQISLPHALDGRYSDDPECAKLLGYEAVSPANGEDFLRIRETKFRT